MDPSDPRVREAEAFPSLTADQVERVSTLRRCATAAGRHRAFRARRSTGRLLPRPRRLHRGLCVARHGATGGARVWGAAVHRRAQPLQRSGDTRRRAHGWRWARGAVELLTVPSASGCRTRHRQRGDTRDHSAPRTHVSARSYGGDDHRSSPLGAVTAAATVPDPQPPPVPSRRSRSRVWGGGAVVRAGLRCR